MPQYDRQTGESAGANSPLLYEMLRRGRSFSGHERHCCFLNTGQTRFANISAASGFDFPDDGRSASLVDWDLDGDLDVWLVNRNGPQVRFLRNDLPANHHYLAFKLTGRTCNRDAIGARVELTLAGPQGTKLVRTLRAGDGYLAQSSKWLHFGLGATTEIKKLSVRWPGGDEEEFVAGADLPIDRRYQLQQGAGKAQPWSGPQRITKLKPSRLDPPASSQAAQILMVYPVPLPALEYQTKDKSVAAIAGERSRPLLLNLWASWCLPCVKELHEFAKRRNELQQAGVDVIALSVDGLGANTSDDNSQQLLSNMSFPFASGWATEQFVDRLQVVHDVHFDLHSPLPVPSSFLIDRDGHLVALYKGPVGVDQVLADLDNIQLSGDLLRQASLRFPGRWHGRTPGHRFLRLALDLHKAGDSDEAALYLLRNEKYFGHAPIYAELAQQIGIVMAAKKNHKVAEQLFRGAVRLKPDSPALHFYLAQSLENTGKAAEAAVEYGKIVELDPNSVLGNFRLGLLLAQNGQVDRALPRFRKTVELKPAWAGARFKLAMALLQQNEPEQALVELQETIRLKPVDPSTQMQLAWTLATHPNPQFRNGNQAVHWAETICTASNYQSPRDLDVLAAAHAEAGQFPRAIETAEKALELVRAGDQKQLAKAIESHLRLYRDQKPFRSR